MEEGRRKRDGFDPSEGRKKSEDFEVSDTVVGYDKLVLCFNIRASPKQSKGDDHAHT